MNTFARSKDPDPTGSGLEKLWQFTLILQITHSFKVKKSQISQKNIQGKFKLVQNTAYHNFLKPRSIVLYCTESQLAQFWCIKDPGEQIEKIV